MANKITQISTLRYYLRQAAGRDISTGDEVRDVAFTLPNGLTLARLLLTPVIIMLLLAKQMEMAFYIFTIAALTDFADGWIAKYFHSSTRLGAFLDPVADKVLTVSIYLVLGIDGIVPGWLVVLIISRDILLVMGLLITWIVFDRIWVAPLGIGKLTTFAQLSLLGLFLLRYNFADRLALWVDNIHFWFEQILTYGIYMVALLTIFSVSAYAVQWFARMMISEADLI